jgi:C4-type Zn-finger protein
MLLGEDVDFSGLEAAIKKLHDNTTAMVKEAEMYQANTEQTDALNKTRAAALVVKHAYDTITGFRVTTDDGILEAKKNADSARQNVTNTDANVKKIEGIVKNIRDLIVNFEVELAEAIRAEIGLHMHELDALVANLTLYVDDYYTMSFMNEISALKQKAEMARDSAKQQFEAARDYSDMDELLGYH